MAVTVNAINSNPTIQGAGVNIYSGVVDFVFKGPPLGIGRDTLSFVLNDPPISLVVQPPQLSAVVSPASFGYDGPMSDVLWAVDGASVTTVNEDRGSGTAQLQVIANLAVRSLNGMLLRVNYTVFAKQ